MGVPKTPSDGRRQAQYLYAAKPCADCGLQQRRMHRHHIDRNPINNAPDNIRVLCSACHAKHHPRPVVRSTCVVCGADFVAKDHRSRAKICSAQCARDWGRTNAQKRWGRAA